MPITAATLRRVMGLSHEAMVEILGVLAEQQEAEEKRLADQRERTRKHRAKRYGNVTVTGVSRNGNAASAHIEHAHTHVEDNPKPIDSLDLKKKETTARDPFDDFWAVYPKRDGDNPRKPAKLSFQRAVAKGAKPDAIISGARRLAVKHPSPTPYVPQAVTWLNQERWNDHESTGPPAAIAKVGTARDFIAERLAQNGARG